MFYFRCLSNLYAILQLRPFKFGIQWRICIDGVGCTLHPFLLSVSVFFTLFSGLSGHFSSCSSESHLVSWRHQPRRRVGYVTSPLCPSVDVDCSTDVPPTAVLPDIHPILPSLSQRFVLDCWM